MPQPLSSPPTFMETFDDFRAEEHCRLLAGMAATGQVVYFAHHRHLCDAARVVAPSVVIHDLQSKTGSRPSDGVRL
jgi:hypothetical protein